MKIYSGKKKKTPDLIGIGLPKAGTTWLYHVLRTQNLISVFPFKEMRYLADLYLYPSNLFKRLTSSERYLQANRTRVVQHFSKKWGSKPLKKTMSESWWIFRIFMLPRSQSRYLSLFPKPQHGKMNTDISPIYWSLPAEAVKKLGIDFPDTKIIILLREPISRAFSQAKMILASSHGKEAIQNLSSDEFFDAFYKVHKYYLDYPSVVKTWQEAFPNRVFVGFYDELEADPLKFYHSICTFLSVQPDDSNPSIQVRQNPGVEKSVPEEFGKKAAELYKPYIHEIHSYFQNSYTEKWVTIHQAYLK